MVCRSFRLSRAVAAAVLALLTVPLVAPVTHAAEAGAATSCGDITVIHRGHSDAFHGHLVSGKPELALKWDERKVGEVLSPEKTAYTVPGALYTTGTEQAIGAPAYTLPQVQIEAYPWVGLDVLELRAGGFTAADVVIDKVSGPGEIAMFLERAIEKNALQPLGVTGSDPTFTLSASTRIVERELTHKHFYTAFTKPGVYQLQAHLDAHKGEQTVSTPSRTYTFVVGVAPASVCDALAKGPGAVDASLLDAATGSAYGGDGAGTTGDGGEQAAKPGEGTAEADAQAQPAPVASQGGGQDAPQGTPAPHASAITAPAGNAGQGGGGAEVCQPTRVSRQVSAAEATASGLVANPAGAGRLGLVPKMKDDSRSPARWVAPDSLTFGIGEAGHTTAPATLAKYGITGRVYLIGQTQVPQVPWVGANTMNETVVAHAAGAVTWRLENVQGPATPLVYESGNFGALVSKVWFAKVGDTTQIEVNRHVHPNWVFPKPGTYRLTISQTARLKDGSTATGSTTLTFIAGGSGTSNAGHFDLGAEIREGAGQAGAGREVTKNADGTYTVTEIVGRTPSGQPCTLTGPLARTGWSPLTPALIVLGGGLLLGGLGAVTLRHQLRQVR